MLHRFVGGVGHGDNNSANMTLHRITIERCNDIVPKRHRGMDREPMNHLPGLSDIPPLRTAYPLGRLCDLHDCKLLAIVDSRLVLTRVAHHRGDNK